MPDNLSPDFVGFARLEDHQLVSLSGPDALAFAQAQFSSDVLALADGHWQWSSWLTAKGRTLSVFQLLRLAPDHVLLVLADDDADEIATQLRRFVFRRKVVLAVREDLQVLGAFLPPPSARGAAIAGSGMLELDVGSATLPRTLRLQASTAAADPAFTLAWRQADLRHGRPRLQADQREQWTPQQLGLDRLNGYSVKKGCYPGQEIVARTHFLGKAKRALQLLQLGAAAEPGASVEQEGKALGTVVCVAGDLALAVLPLDTSDATLSVDGVAAHRRALLDGLAR